MNTSRRSTQKDHWLPINYFADAYTTHLSLNNFIYIIKIILTINIRVMKGWVWDEQASSFINRCAPFTRVPDKEIWPDLNTKGFKDDVKFLRKTNGVDQRWGISISRDSSWFAILTFQFDIDNENHSVLERQGVYGLSNNGCAHIICGYSRTKT